MLSRTLGLAGAVASISLFAGCALGTSGSSELDPYLCTSDDVGDGYQELTRGNFSPRDLADLGDDADAQERALRDAGMQSGRFAFFKQSLPKPPFDPPMHVVCQVIRFDDDASASAWLAALTETNIVDSVFAGELRTVEGRVIERRLDPPALPRVFALYGGVVPGEQTLRVLEMLNILVSVEGRFVRTLAIGGSNEPVALETAATVVWSAWTTD